MSADNASLQKSVRHLRLAVVAMGCVLIAVVATGFSSPDDRIVRARGIVIEDSQGRARIVIGAPAPDVPERLRTNKDKWQETFAWLYPQGDIAPLAGLNNDVFGMLVLDEKGQDRVAIGAPVPDPLNGRRIGPAYGISFHDDDGIERGGFGHLKDKAKGLDRVGIGLDGRDGEGVIILVDGDGTAGLVANDNKQGKRLFTGVAPAGSIVSPQSTERRMGTIVTNEDGSESIEPAAR